MYIILFKIAFIISLAKFFEHTTRVKLSMLLFVAGNFVVRVLPALFANHFSGPSLLGGCVLIMLWSMFITTFLVVLDRAHDSIGGWLFVVAGGGMVYLLLL